MSKRSGMSRIEDLRRWFVDLGRYRYILHKIDMEPWRDKFCPVCGEGFTSEPGLYFMNYAIHYTNSRGEECSYGVQYDAWLSAKYAELDCE